MSDQNKENQATEQKAEHKEEPKGFFSRGFRFVKKNYAVIVTILFLTSELLAQIPKVGANSVFQLVFGALKKEAQQSHVVDQPTQ